MLAFLAFLAVVGVVGLAAVRGAVRKHGAFTLAWRFLAGHHMDGRYRTDAGWLRPGVRVMHPTGHASRWAHLPLAARGGIRLALLLLGAGTCAGLAIDSSATVLALIIAAAIGAVGLGWLTWLRAREWTHVRRYVRPLHRSLAPLLGIPLAARPQSWLTVPRGFEQLDGAQIRLQLPEGTLATAEVRRAIGQALGDKLALEGTVNVEFATVGASPAAVVTTSSPPPARVAFAHGMLPAVEAARETAPLLGIGRNGTQVTADYDAESPHVLVSAGSGGGKSTIVRGLVCQALHHGGIAVICDIKRISHTWARGLPNVGYARDIEDIHKALIAVKGEVDRRNVLVDELADENGDLPPEADEQIGPSLILVMEEMNATANRLMAYWRKVKTKDDAAISPAVEALNDTLFMGRAVRVRCVAVAQMMTARTLGGPEARENFATRILARYTMNAWKMLCPEVWPMPRRTNHVGRVQVVSGGAAKETQVIFFTPGEAREWAMSGAVSRFMIPELPGGPGGLPAADVPGGQDGHTLDGEAGTVPALPGPVTLREAIDSGILAVSLDSARAARKRDSEFPRSAGIRDGAMTYDPDALAKWERNRPRGGGDQEESAL